MGKTCKQMVEELSKSCLEILVLEKEKRDIYNSAYKVWEESGDDVDLGRLVDIAYEDYQSTVTKFNDTARLFFSYLNEEY